MSIKFSENNFWLCSVFENLALTNFAINERLKYNNNK